MTKRHSGLGRGLDALIPPKKIEKQSENTDIRKNKAKHYDTEEQAEAYSADRTEAAALNVKGVSEDKNNNTVKRKKADAPAAASKIKSAVSDSVPANAEIMVNISLVEPNRSQPRKKFADEPLKELSDSIRQYGVIQPLLVQKKDDYFEIIAGERRWRAAKMAGLKEIPVLVKEFSNQRAVEISLIENIQREDLNPIEEARAYKRLIDEFSMRQEDVADRVSRNRSSVTNSIRLLKLDERIQNMLIDGSISEGHARALLMIPDLNVQYAYAERIFKEHLSVRQTEQLVKSLMEPKKHPAKKRAVDVQKETVLKDISGKLKDILGTKVTINQIGKNKGRIEIEYYSEDELERIYDLMQELRGLNK